jgi:hypothetical protein
MNDTNVGNESRDHTRRLTTVGIAILVATFTIGFWGCSDQSGTLGTTSADGDAAAEDADDSVTELAIPSQGVPEALVVAGELGENIYDSAKADDWKTANSKMADLLTEAQHMSEDATGSVTFDSTLTDLEKSILAKDRTATLVDANRLTLEVANLTAKYDPPVPVEIHKLDYYGRELQIWSAAKDSAMLKETAQHIRDTWDAVRPDVEARGATKEVAAFDALVARTDAAKTPAEYGRLATPILDEVDKLENVFGA